MFINYLMTSQTIRYNTFVIKPLLKYFSMENIIQFLFLLIHRSDINLLLITGQSNFEVTKVNTSDEFL